MSRRSKCPDCVAIALFELEGAAVVANVHWAQIRFALEQKAPHQVSQTAPTLFTDNARKKHRSS